MVVSMMLPWCFVSAQQPQPAAPADGDGQGVYESVAGLATGEVMRRQEMVRNAQQLIQAGAIAQADGRYGEAMDNFQAAFESLPESTSVTSIRRAAFQRYQSAAVQYAQEMIDQAQWPEARRALTESIKLGKEAGMPPSALDPGVRRMLRNLDDPQYYATGITPQHLERVDKVKRLLLLAQGYVDYGDFDRAARTYNQVLLIDRYNSAARNGLENVERLKLNYYDVARNQARATMLRQIAEGWETPVPLAPSDAIFSPEDAPVSGRRADLEEKLQTIVIPSIEFEGVPLTDVLELLQQRSAELDFAETDPSLKGINIILDRASYPAGSDPGALPVTLKLGNVPLGDVLRYVNQLTGSTYRVDNFAVKILSTSAAVDTAMENRVWTVPPGFLTQGGGGPAAALNTDPFAAPAAGDDAGLVVKRKTAKEYLEENGVEFPDGAIANFNAATSSLLVRNTPQQLALVDNLVQSARDGVNKMVQIGVKMIRITQDAAQQAGVDWMLGPSNVGSAPRVFTNGGTSGTAANPSIPADFSFLNPAVNAPVGLNPVTDGLRTGTFSTGTTIEDVISRTAGVSANGEAPSVFSVAGVFTDPQFQAQIRLLSQSKGVDTLCDTKVTVRPGQRAKVEIMREFIYPTEYDPPEIPNEINVTSIIIGGPPPPPGPNDFPVTPATPTAFEMRPLGKIIEVEPTVSGDDTTVSVNVLADFSEFLGFINYGTPITVPGIGGALLNQGSVTLTDNRILMPVFETVRETTDVTVWDGQTIAIGGFIGHSIVRTEDKLPFIGDLPVVGRLFRAETSEHRKSGLMIFLSVQLIDPAGQPINRQDEELTGNYPRAFNPPQGSPTPVFASPPPGALPGYQK